jgi:hypothetical protein
MNDYIVEITYKTGAQRIQHFHRCQALSEYSAKAQAKRQLNRTGIFGSFTYKVYGGNPSVDTEQQVF